MSVDDTNPIFDQIIAEYLEQTQSGRTPDRQKLLNQHPDLADDLRSFFGNHDQMKQAATSEDATLPPGAVAPPGHIEDATLPPSGLPAEDATLPPTRNSNEDATIPPGGAQIGVPEVGTKVKYFGDYELLNEIARGGMGVVYKARQVNLNRIVALKMILAGQLAADEDVQRFHAEAEAAANLDHPGIVPIFEVGEHEGQHYFSMGFVEGESLADKIKDGPLPPRVAAEYTKKVAEAMVYAHERGVIHRDLKPANVLLDHNDEPKVTDFGLAKKVEGDSGLTATGQILGTPSYMPPEQASGKIDEITETADVYSLGAILYALTTGRPPFQADNHLDTLLQVLEQEPVSPNALNLKVPRDLETVCLKCLEKDRRRRYATAQEMVDEFQRFLNGEPIRARPVSRLEWSWRWCKRKPLAASFMGTAAVLLIAVFVVIVMATRRTSLERERSLYLTRMQNAWNDWEAGNVVGMMENLDWYLPREGGAFRSWEWHYMRNLLQQDLSTLPHDSPVSSASWSRDSQRIVTTTEKGSMVWDAITAEPLFRLESLTQTDRESTLKSIAWSGDDRALLGMNGSRVCVWDGKTGRLVRVHSQGTAVQVSASSRIAIANEEGVQIWDMQTRRELAVIPKVTEAIALDSDGAQLAIVDQDHVVVWSVDNPRAPIAEFRQLRTRQESQQQVVVWARDGKSLAIGGDDGQIHVWNMSRQELVTVLSASTNRIVSLAWSPDGRKIAAASDNVRVWNIANSRLLSVIRGHMDVLSVAWSPNGERLISSSSDGSVKVWDGIDLPQDATRFRGSAFAWNSDGTLLALGTKEPNIAIAIWDAVQRKTIQEIRNPEVHRIRRLAWSLDGSRVAAACSGPYLIQVWDVATATRVFTADTDKNTSALAFNPAGSKLAVAQSSGFISDEIISELSDLEIDVWDLDNGGGPIQATPADEVDGWFTVGRPHRDRNAVRGYDGRGDVIEVRDTRTDAAVLSLPGPRGRTDVRHIGWSPGGKRLAAGNDFEIVVFDASIGYRLGSLEPVYERSSIGYPTYALQKPKPSRACQFLRAPRPDCAG